jgi:aspartyl-tRNA(Asn)/glutamyl-tRNA(Gln) amidotransferase subunit C
MISKDEVKNIAALARIGINEKETDKFSRDLSAILDWVEELKKADMENVEPTAHITGSKNQMRDDKEENFENKEGITKLFPENKNGYDKVRAVF